MLRSSSAGFSLIELLIALFLTSCVSALFLSHISLFGLQGMKLIETARSQDNAIASLLLIEHQVQHAGLTECTGDIHHIDDQSGDPNFASLSPYEIISKEDPLATRWKLTTSGRAEMVTEALFLHSLSQTFYASSASENSPLIAPSSFSGVAGDMVLIDDCSQALLAPIISVSTIYGQGKRLEIHDFTASQFTFPLSLSLVETHIYYLGKTTTAGPPYSLFEVDDSHQREELLPELASLDFQEENGQLLVTVSPQYQEAYYHESL